MSHFMKNIPKCLKAQKPENNSEIGQIYGVDLTSMKKVCKYWDF